jgi:hypothetical protein
MNRTEANALLGEITEAVTTARRRNARPHVVMVDSRLHKKLQLALGQRVSSVVKIPVCAVPGYRLGWQVQSFTGGVG